MSSKIFCLEGMTFDEFLALPVISSQFPVVLGPGSLWTKMDAFCAACDLKFPEEALRGHITNPFGKVFLVDAWGLCSCETFTHVSHRLMPDMTVVGKTSDGEWATWRGRISWRARLRTWIRKHLGFKRKLP
jgi:hypothetical protein